MDAAMLATDPCARAELIFREVSETWDGGPDGELAVNVMFLVNRLTAAARYFGFGEDLDAVALAFEKFTGERLC